MLSTQLLLPGVAALLGFGFAPAVLAQTSHTQQMAILNGNATTLQSNVLQNTVLILPNVPPQQYADSWGWRSSRSLPPTPAPITVVILNSQVNLAAEAVEPRSCGQRCRGSLRLP
ncbi:hypothetical protein [Synechococcus sp. W60.2]|uniref:hypothetical protein n=1 Tax=Synechococcus sp. W60.2 TaxID=2964521 RepID=UPI0039C0F513